MKIITSDEQLFQHAARARGRVVLVTGQLRTSSGRLKLIICSHPSSIGGAAGPGRDAAMAFAKNGYLPLYLQVTSVH